MKIAAAFLLGTLGWLAADVKPAPPRITAIYPTAHVLPANHLKFYLHFSQPMRQGVFLQYCRLLDDHDQPVLEPFRETELWNEEGTRLTLWFHPGRQKTGVNLNVELGPIVEPHRHYRLIISGQWPSAAGVPLGDDVEKTFQTSARATAQLEASAWKIIPPAAGTKKPFEVRFPAPLDSALLQRCLRISDSAGKPVAGSSQLVDSEKSWRFVPRDSWFPAKLTLEVDSILEDLAGNSLARPFQVDLAGPAPKKVSAIVRVEFEIQAR